MIQQGDVWWADLGTPPGSTAGFIRPVVVVQADIFNNSRLKTVVCIPLTSQLHWAQSPGNLLLTASATGLDKDSVAQPVQIVAVDKRFLLEHVGRISQRQLEQLFNRIDVVLGR